MVLRKPVGGHLQPASQPFSQIAPSSPTSSLYSPPSNTGEPYSAPPQEQPQHDVKNLRSPDSDSDWDASDREEEAGHLAARKEQTITQGSEPQSPQPHLGPQYQGKHQSLTPQHSPHLDERASPVSVGKEDRHEPYGADGLDILAQSLSINTKSDALQETFAAPLSPGGRQNTNPFRREPSNEHIHIAELASTPNTTLSPTNPFRQNASALYPPLVSSSTTTPPQVSYAGAQEAPQSSYSTYAYPRFPRQSQAGARASSIFDAEAQPIEPQTASRAVDLGLESSASPVGTASTTTANTAVMRPETTAEGTSRKDRNEVYQVRTILWKDPVPSSKLRESPILIQNANGPCPLLALVNALVLSTPPNTETALVETLRTRENISLGLLLDAVFDELMSGRRGTTALELPDVHQLYTFLLALHTGMNVNPRFVAEPGGQTGGFEQTNEMLLYGTFDLPLIHGWLPLPSDAAHAAFARSAPSYDDAQSLLFREEELERGLNSGQLNAQDETAFIDLTVIKQFLSSWPTQLTSHGLDVINETIRSCQIGILFRNDHFSTVFKEPSSGRLMTLVTDAGFASHAEVVWESLIDVNGGGSEFFSGDFRPLSHSEQGRSQPAPNPREEHRVEPPAQPERPTLQQDNATAHTRSTSEQEDHDLALAMQLQEEEEERERRDQAARRRDERLSEQYLSQDSSNNRSQQGPNIPPRRSQQSTPPARQNNNEPETAPPTYEESRMDRPYNPSSNAPSEYTAPRADTSSDSRRMSRRARNSSGGAVPLGGTSAMPQQHSPYMTTHEAVSERREGCVVQ